MRNIPASVRFLVGLVAVAAGGCGNSNVTRPPDKGTGGIVDMSTGTVFHDFYMPPPPDLRVVDQSVKPVDMTIPDYAIQPILYDYLPNPYDLSSGVTDDMEVPPPDDMGMSNCVCVKPCQIMCFGNCCLEDIISMACTPDPNCLGGLFG